MLPPVRTGHTRGHAITQSRLKGLLVTRNVSKDSTFHLCWLGQQSHLNPANVPGFLSHNVKCIIITGLITT